MEGDSSAAGPKYVRLTGGIVENLLEEERQGRINLPPKFGNQQHRDVTLIERWSDFGIPIIERWSDFGIPILFLLGLGLGEVALDNNNLWIVFRRVIRLIHDDDLSLGLSEAAVNLRKIGQSIILIVDNFVRRLKEADLRNVDPILTRLATAEHMDNVGPAFQNLVDLINEKRYTGTLRELVGLEGAPRGTFADRNAPMYRLRRQRRVEIFNHAMRADPCNGSMHTLESLVSYMDQAGETLVQIAQCIRIYNYGRPRRENKLTVRQLVLDVIRLYTQSTSAVVFTVPARAVAINTILGFSALFDVLRGHVENKV